MGIQASRTGQTGRCARSRNHDQRKLGNDTRPDPRIRHYLENTQLDPDIYVLNAPETIVKGEDTQLKAAVDELLKEIGE